MDLHIEKVADRMGGKRGAGQSLDSSLYKWYNKWGQVTSSLKNGPDKILFFWLSNCELTGVNTRIYWNKPFDILFEIGQEKSGVS